MRGKRSKSALGRLNNLDKSLEAEELLRKRSGLIEKRYPARELPDSSPRFPDIPRINVDEETKFVGHQPRSGFGLKQPIDLGDKIRRRINGGS